jgi:hypothetical protein
MILSFITLDVAAKIAEIVTASCAVVGLSIWKYSWIKTKIMYMRLICATSKITNIFRRERWLWSHVGVFYKYIKSGRDRWNRCHDKLGNIIYSEATMGDLSRFDKFGLYHDDGLTPLDNTRIEELKKLYPNHSLSAFFASMSKDHQNHPTLPQSNE